MISTLSTIMDKSLSLLQHQRGTVAFEYLLVIAGVSVAVIAAVAFGAPSLIKLIMVDGLCESFDDVIPPGTQWACHGGIWPSGWYDISHAPH